MAESKARIAKSKLWSERRCLSLIATEATIHLPFLTAFFEGEGRKRRIMDGKEVLVINELFTSIKENEKDKLIEELTDEEYGSPIFYQAYLDSKK